MRLGIIVGLIALLIAGAAGGYFYLYHPKSPVSIYKATTSSQKNAFSSIADALAKKLSLKCDYTTANTHTIAYVKNGEVRSDVTDLKDAKLSGSVIVKDKKIYYWNSQGTGFVMAIPEITGTIPSPSTAQNNSGQNTLQNLEAYKQNCQVAAVSDSLFVIPTDIKFTDQTQVMRSVPTGASGGSVPTNYQQQVQQYMQQYKTPAQ